MRYIQLIVFIEHYDTARTEICLLFVWRLPTKNRLQITHSMKLISVYELRNFNAQRMKVAQNDLGTV